ncbi:MAG: ribonuclease HII [Treponema sp.]|nr:ribonuclease HII [Treponema sp.]
MSGLICGLDEAGRGPLAGPVSAAAVILPDDFPSGVLDDSKKLSRSAREEARILIYKGALAWGIGWASPAEIDEINILKASLLAMKRAYYHMIFSINNINAENNFLNLSEIQAIADGLFIPDIPIPCKALIKADSIVPAVMAASIVAKTARDRLMEYYAIFYPQYGYEKHKGYPVKAHREAIKNFGPSPIQRKSFKVKF